MTDTSNPKHSPMKRIIPAVCFVLAAIAGYAIAQEVNTGHAEASSAQHKALHEEAVKEPAARTATQTVYGVTDAFVRETPMKMSAGYLVISNTTDKDDTLTSASADWAERIELHNVLPDENGVMNMKQVSSMPLPAHGTLSLRPGSYHLMIFGVKDGLRVGENKTITLHFENAGKQNITFEVQPIAYQGQQAQNTSHNHDEAEHHHHH